MAEGPFAPFCGGVQPLPRKTSTASSLVRVFFGAVARVQRSKSGVPQSCPRRACNAAKAAYHKSCLRRACNAAKAAYHKSCPQHELNAAKAACHSPYLCG